MSGMTMSPRVGYAQTTSPHCCPPYARVARTSTTPPRTCPPILLHIGHVPCHVACNATASRMPASDEVSIQLGACLYGNRLGLITRSKSSFPAPFVASGWVRLCAARGSHQRYSSHICPRSSCSEENDASARRAASARHAERARISAHGPHAWVGGLLFKW